MHRTVGLAVVATMLAWGQQVHAAPITIVDTGPGPSVATGWSLYSGQWLAAEFSVGSAVTVTSAEGWMYSSEGSDYVVALYSDGGDVPGTSLHSALFSVPSVLDPQWWGASGLSWALTAGTYWIVFEDAGGSGAMPHPSVSPLGNEAYTSGGVWLGNDGLSLGVRIVGEDAVVPEPATLLLLGTGLAAAGVRRQMKKRA